MCQPLVRSGMSPSQVNYSIRPGRRTGVFQLCRKAKSPAALLFARALLPGRHLHSGIRNRCRTIFCEKKEQKRKLGVELTEPEEAERAYQDHFLLILCENLATPAMMGYDTKTKDEKRKISCHVPSYSKGWKRSHPNSWDPRSRMILDLQHNKRNDGQDGYGGLCQRVRS